MVILIKNNIEVMYLKSCRNREAREKVLIQFLFLLSLFFSLLLLLRSWAASPHFVLDHKTLKALCSLKESLTDRAGDLIVGAIMLAVGISGHRWHSKLPGERNSSNS